MFTNREFAELLTHLVSGGVGGAVSTAITYPLSNLRFRAIQHDSPEKEEIQKREKKSRIRKFIEKNFELLTFIKDLYLRNEITTLYDGLSSSIICSIVSNGVYFCSYKFWDRVFDFLDLKQSKVTDSIITSLLAALCTAFISNPIYVLNSRMTKPKSEIGEITNWEMMKKIYSEEGIDGFYKGIIPSLVLTLNPVIQFSLYEVMKDSFARSSTGLTTKHIAYISFISKFVTTVITYPLMTIKTIIQAEDKKSTDEVLQYLYSIIKTDGFVNGYFKGFSAKILQTMLNNVILMLTYEKIQLLVRYALLKVVFRVKK